MASPTFVAKTETAQASAATVAVDVPAGIADGDTLLAQIVLQGNTAIDTPPAGWTFVREDRSGGSSSNVATALYVREVANAAGEPASYTWTLTQDRNRSASMLAYRGAGGVDVHSGTTISGTSIAAPSVATTVDDCVLIALYGFSHPSFTNRTWTSSPAGMTSRILADTALTGRHVLDEERATSGATGDRTAQTNASVALTGQLVALSPAAPPPPTFTGTITQTLPALTQQATGDATTPASGGTIAQTLPSLTQQAAGTHSPPAYTGSAAQTLPSLTQSATGTTTAPTFTGVAAQTLPALTQQAVGDATSPNAITQTLPALTQQATGTHVTPDLRDLCVTARPIEAEWSSSPIVAEWSSMPIVDCTPELT